MTTGIRGIEDLMTKERESAPPDVTVSHEPVFPARLAGICA